MAFSFRGLDIRHRLPDAKRSRECSERPAALSVYRGFETPERCVPVLPSILPRTTVLRQIANVLVAGRSSSSLSPAAGASSATFHSGLFLPQRDPDNSCVLDARVCGNQTSLRALPWRGARGFPIIFVPKITRYARPSPCSGWAIPAPLAPCRPAFARRRSACRYMPRMA